jgi:hypothetical protein
MNRTYRALSALLLMQPALAQAPAWTTYGESAGDNFGFSMVTADDWNSDGVADLLVGSPGVDGVGPDTGRISLFSGATGAELFEVDGLNGGDRAGRSVASLGDVNGDGVGDFAYGAPTRSVSGPQAGGVFLISGADGAVISSWEGTTPYGIFGFSVANAGDLDNDGLNDLLVGAPNEDPSGPDSGAVYAFSTGSFNPLHTLSGANPGDKFGATLISVGDTDLDAIPDFLVGSPDETSGGIIAAGSARLYSGADASSLGAWFGLNAGARYGAALSPIGDRDSDGCADFAIGAPGDVSGGGPACGRVELRSGLNGGLFLAINGAPTTALGASLSALGDLNSDGVCDLLVGAPDAPIGGAVLLFSGLDAALLDVIQASSEPNSQFGLAIASLNPPDAAGPPQWAASSPLKDLNTSNDHGALSLYSDQLQPGEVFCSGDGSAAPCPCGNTGPEDHGCANGDGTAAHLRATGSSSISNNDLSFLADALPPGQPALLYTGINRIQSGQGVGFGDGLRCTGGAVFRLGVRFADPVGDAEWSAPFVSTPWSAGTTRHFQAWYRNTPSPACGSGYNLSNGYSVSFTP